MRILFVCTGNLCRSPLAEAAMRKLVEDMGLSSEFDLDSAGIGCWHPGEPPHPLAVAVGAKRGYLVSGHARGWSRPPTSRMRTCSSRWITAISARCAT